MVFEVFRSLLQKSGNIMSAEENQNSQFCGSDRRAQHRGESYIDLSRPQHNLLLLNIPRSAGKGDIYQCVRCCWRLSPEKARQADYVLAVYKEEIIGVYKARRWFSTDKLPREYFAFDWQYDYIARGTSGRFGFEGCEAAAQTYYLNKRITALPHGKSLKAQNPVCYAFKDKAA